MTFTFTVVSIGVANLGFIFGVLPEGQFSALIALCCVFFVAISPSSFKLSTNKIIIFCALVLLAIPITNYSNFDFVPFLFFILKFLIASSLPHRSFNSDLAESHLARVCVVILSLEVVVYLIFVSLDLSIGERKLFYSDYSGRRYGGFAFEMVDQVTFLTIAAFFVLRTRLRLVTKILFFVAIIILAAAVKSNFLYLITLNFIIFYVIERSIGSRALRFLIFVCFAFQSLLIYYAVSSTSYFEFIILASDTREGARLLPNHYLLDCLASEGSLTLYFGMGFVDFQSLCSTDFMYLNNASGAVKLIATYGLIISIPIVLITCFWFSGLSGSSKLLAVTILTYFGNQASFTNFTMLVLLFYLLRPYEEKA